VRSAPIEGAIQALVMLGQRRAEAEATVDRVIQIDPSLQETSAIVQAAFRLRGGPR
jgi:Holliday junction resolvasome RuvABC DNA-binding subunit